MSLKIVNINKNIDVIKSEFDTLVEKKEIEILPSFLKKIGKENKESMQKYIKEKREYYKQYIELKPKTAPDVYDAEWGFRWDDTQKTIIVLTGISLLNNNDLSRWEEVNSILKKIELDKFVKEIILEYRPKGFNIYLKNQIKKNIWNQIDYITLRQLEALNLVDFEPIIFSSALAFMNDSDVNSKSSKEYLEFLLNTENTITRDIPLLFEYETAVNNSYGKDEFSNYSGKQLWDYIFNSLISNGGINRVWLIENCLNVQTKDWNNNLKSFFRKRVDDLKPTKEELILLQNSIFPLLNDSHNQILNWSITLIKHFYDKENFNFNTFFEYLPSIMMRSDCKSSIKTIQIIFDKILKTQKVNPEKILELLADSFAINDLTIQEKSVDLILKNKIDVNLEIIDRLMFFESQMLGNVSNSLNEYFQKSKNTNNSSKTPEIESSKFEYQYTQKRIRYLHNNNKIELPKTWNELLNLIGDNIQYSGVTDFEIIINSLVLLKPVTPIDYSIQCNPYLNQIEKLFYNGSFANFNKDFIKAWMKNELNEYTKILKQGYQENDQNYNSFSWYYRNSIQPVKLHLKRLLFLAEKLKGNSILPLLSLPTHSPAYIEPKVLIERIIAYQEKGEKINVYDLSIAIARMKRENLDEALVIVDKITGTLNKLMSFVLSKSNEIDITPSKKGILQLLYSKLVIEDISDSEMVQLWAVAARTFYPEETFEIFQKTPISEFLNVEKPFIPEIISYTENHSYLDKLIHKMKPKLPKNKEIPLLLLYSQEVFENTTNYDLLSNIDLEFWAKIIPQNNKNIFIYLINYQLTEDSNTSDCFETGLRFMLSNAFLFDELSMLVLAAACIIKKRKHRGLAAEVCILHFGNQTLDTNMLGKKLGYLILNNFAPLNRLSEMIELTKGVSNLHNEGLILTLNSMFESIKSIEEFPNNFKKILELYFDLRVKSKIMIPENIKLILNNWSNNNILKNICNQIIQ